ncbi:alpha/beta hydrolase [Micromonospora echinofusca]|uniref:Alpha/beta fold hydrolase n=1 Tax=Micromonospora echinofusca TaxID=47858 RepID=A0ABS3VRW8_MICEH|nr:alpha/beta hydrolase [Micromonospora echinofusca]MBO4207286.1 alpha/beta fold hydrolase [Micromonospora echinofusca]
MATYVLIPGAGGAAWTWHRLRAELCARGRDVVAVDLPADDDSAGLDAYAAAVVRAVGERRDLIVVAHSLGGFTAPLVCERLPVRLLVLLSAMIPVPGEPPARWWDNTGYEQARREQAARGGVAADADLAETFFHDVPPEVAAEAGRLDRGQSMTPMERPWPLPAWPEVPTRFLLCRDDRFFPADFMRRVVRDRLGVPPDEMAGGHLVMLSRPVELADRLEAYRAGLGVTDGG